MTSVILSFFTITQRKHLHLFTNYCAYIVNLYSNNTICIYSDREKSRMTCSADFHMGSMATFFTAHRILGTPAGGPGFMSRFTRQRSNTNSSVTQKFPYSTRLDKNRSPRTAVVFGTCDGSVGMYIPVEERTYRRLALLQQIMSTALESSFALNPRDFRVFRSSRTKTNVKKGLLDGTILWKFVSLDAKLQDELTASMGTSTDLMLENLHELDTLTSFF